MAQYAKNTKVTLCEKLAFLSRSREWPLTPTSDEARALVCDHQMKPDGRVFERDVWLDGRTQVVRPAAATSVWTRDGEDLASGQIRPRPASPAASEEKLSERVVQPSQLFLPYK